MKARFLEVGDLCVGHDGVGMAVEEVSDTRSVETVYNFRVADYHTYFVGCDEWGFSVWAHNAEYDVRVLRNSSGSVEAYDIHNAKGDFVRRFRTKAEADRTAASWNAASDPVAAPGRQGAYPPLDKRRYPQSPDSTVFSNTTADGKYVYVLDENNVLHIAPEGSHMHPRVLGGG